MVPDNLKAAVIRASLRRPDGEPVLNRSYRELRAPLRLPGRSDAALQPREEGQGRVGGGYVKHNFMAAIGEERDVAVLNDRARSLGRARSRPTRSTAPPASGRSRSSSRSSRPSTAPACPLPAGNQSRGVEAEVQRDTHALIDGALYSVPWRLVGKQLLARVGLNAASSCTGTTHGSRPTSVSPGGRAPDTR